MPFLTNDCSVLTEFLLNESQKSGYKYREPTSLVSPFWFTSLTPSSSEVMFRELEAKSASAGSSNKIVTIQPCIRFSDMSPFSDGIHQIYFHMFTCFVIDCNDPKSEVDWFLKTLEQAGLPIENSSFSYFKEPSIFVKEPKFTDFGKPLLDDLTIPFQRQIPCEGMANYQIGLHKDETGNNYEIWGPRIEVFSTDNLGIEYGTLIYGQGKIPGNKKLFPPVLALVVGIERSELIKKRIHDLWNLPELEKLLHQVLSLYFPAHTFPVFRKNVSHCLELLIAISAISNEKCDIEPSDRGVGNQLRRIARSLKRDLISIGCQPSDFAKKVLNISGFLKAFPDANVQQIEEWVS